MNHQSRLEIESILIRRFGDVIGEGKDEVQVDCPFCEGHRKLWVNLSKKLVHCFKCEYGSGLQFFFKKIGEKVETTLLQDPKYLSETEDVDIVKHVDRLLNGLVGIEHKSEKVELPREYRSFVKSGEIGRIALDYLRKRGIYMSHADKYKLGYCASGIYRNRVVIPCYMDGELVYYTGRAFYPGVTRKYLNPPVNKIGVLYNYDNLAEGTRATIVEGTFDAMKGGDGFIALLGKHLSRKQKSAIQRKNPSEIVIMLDPDALTDAMIMARELKHLCPVRVVTEHVQDAGSLTHEEVLKLADWAKIPDIRSEVEVIVRTPRK